MHSADYPDCRSHLWREEAEEEQTGHTEWDFSETNDTGWELFLIFLQGTYECESERDWWRWKWGSRRWRYKMFLWNETVDSSTAGAAPVKEWSGRKITEQPVLFFLFFLETLIALQWRLEQQWYSIIKKLNFKIYETRFYVDFTVILYWNNILQYY